MAVPEKYLIRGALLFVQSPNSSKVTVSCGPPIDGSKVTCQGMLAVSVCVDWDTGAVEGVFWLWRFRIIKKDSRGANVRSMAVRPASVVMAIGLRSPVTGFQRSAEAAVALKRKQSVSSWSLWLLRK